MTNKSKNKKECKFNVTIDIHKQFKAVCCLNNVRMADVIEYLMLDYIKKQKEIPPE